MTDRDKLKLAFDAKEQGRLDAIRDAKRVEIAETLRFAAQQLEARRAARNMFSRKKGKR